MIIVSIWTLYLYEHCICMNIVSVLLNLDQIPSPYSLINRYTMTKEGSKQVAIAGSADHRQITGTFTITLSGKFRRPQLIYQGNTKKCYPSFKFPDDFNVTHSSNHWSNEEKTKGLINVVIMNLGLRRDKEWLLIADVLRGQWTDAVKSIIEGNNGKMTPVSANMTNVFQPLDLTVNRNCKTFYVNIHKIGIVMKLESKWKKD